MKKSLFAICMAAIMLTGCGNTAGTAENSTPAVNSSDAVDSEESVESEQDTESQQAEQSSEQSFYDWWGIDMPVPAGMEEVEAALKKDLQCWTNDAGDNTVYYAMDFSYDDEYLDESKGHTLDELPEVMLWQVDEYLLLMCGGSTGEKISRMTVDSKTETEFLGAPVLCEKGTFTLNNDHKANYVIYYSYQYFPRSDRKHVPSFWIAFTESDDKEALELMERAAEAPLKEAKLHE